MSVNPLMRLISILIILFALGTATVAAQPPKVVATINPIHSLVAGVMQDIGKPKLLVSGGQSPHSFSLKPSSARLLSNAGAIFWVGENIETFIVKSLVNIDGNARIVEWMKLDGLTLLEPREGGIWGEDHHDHGHGHGHSNTDNHIWLDPKNAKIIVSEAVAVLSDLDPQNAPRYRKNADSLHQRLDDLVQEIDRDLVSLREVPYVVFHDAYQYFENRFKMNALGSITLEPGRPPGAKRLFEIRNRIIDSNIRCVFREPQFEPKLAHSVTEGTAARIEILDPLGAELPSGPDAYFQLIRGLVSSISRCASR